MRAVIQKTGKAFVEVDGKRIGEIENGLVILLGVTHSDSKKDIDYLVEKIVNLRLFEDNNKYFEKSLLETNKQALVISQFTLYATTKKGRRPDFKESAKSDTAKPLYELFIQELKGKGIKVEQGEFGALMEVTLTNIGPVTITLDSHGQ